MNLDDIEDIENVELRKQRHKTVHMHEAFEMFFDKYILGSENIENMNVYEKNVYDAIQGPNCRPMLKPKDAKQLQSFILRGIDIFGNDGNFNWIDVSELTSLAGAFAYKSEFNGDISKWDVSRVVNMNYMFYGCKSFKCDLSKWNTKALKFAQGCFKESGYDKELIENNWNLKGLLSSFNIF